REAVPVPIEIRVPADALEDALPSLTHSDLGAPGELFTEPEPIAEIFFAWCRAATWRRDVQLAQLFRIASGVDRFEGRVVLGVRDRVVEGPLHDALACAPLLGDGHDLALPENVEARARLEILVWEAGAGAIEVPALGKWIWGS